MPIYEDRCPDCRGKFSVLVRHPGQETQARCPRCKNTRVKRLISSFATVRSEEEQFESLADPSMLADVDENDPQSIARWARRMRRSLGDELGDEFDELIDGLESGEWDEEMGGGGAEADEDLGWG